MTTLTLASPRLFAAGLTLGVIAVAIALARRIAIPRATAALLALGLVCAVLGAGGLTWRHERVGRLAVVVDVSPSTAGAAYHDHQKLATRLEQLLGGRSHFTLYQLAAGMTRRETPDTDKLPRVVNAKQTTYAPPADADAVVLFTDAQFTAAPTPPGPPTYVVLDAALDDPPDGAVERLELRGDQVVATVFSALPGRRLTIDGAADVTDAPLGVGRFVVSGAVRPDAPPQIAAYVMPWDPWAWNNTLLLRRPAPPVAQRWWVGGDPPPSTPSAGAWTRLDVEQLPGELPDFLAAGVIVLDNVAATALDDMQRWRLQQYVRDLGGGLVILGGDHAFAAGAYTGSALESLSPLASTPPQPAAQWLILIDSSGSMARTLGDNTRWHFAVNAVNRVVPLLPGDDTIGVGSFSQALRWFVAGRSVRDAQAGFAWPKDLRPGGPTNLAGALRLVADTADGALPTQLLIVTDAEAKFDAPAPLADALAAKRVRVSILLGAASVPADHPLRLIASRTGGVVTAQPDPREWAGEFRRLARAASPPWLQETPMTVRFTPAGPRVPDQRAPTPWNRTWLKRDATELAAGEVEGGERVPAIAAWNLGSGAVIAAAYAPTPAVAALLAERVETPPRDPRFKVTHDAGRQLRVTLDAAESDGAYMNDLTPRLTLATGGDDAAAVATDAVRMTQVAPGRYEASLPAPTRPAFVAVSVNNRVVDRFAVAGRYPPEFDRIGNDAAAMTALARATGGAVIEPAQTTPIDFKWPTRRIPLGSYLGAASATLIAAGLVRWRFA